MVDINAVSKRDIQDAAGQGLDTQAFQHLRFFGRTRQSCDVMIAMHGQFTETASQHAGAAD